MELLKRLYGGYELNEIIHFKVTLKKRTFRLGVELNIIIVCIENLA